MPSSKELFKKYLNPVFVETGSYYGDGIQNAIDAGFKYIYSIELSLDFYLYCFDRFCNENNVHLIHGESPLALERIISVINEPITFWLDGHYSGEDTARGKTESPLFEELNVIGKHKIKGHTIIIDDLRCWSVGGQGFDTDILKQKILDINSKYSFILEDGFVPKDILVAKIYDNSELSK